MATLVHASTDWQVFVNKNGGMCEKFHELREDYKVFWRTRTLKTQVFKKLKGIFCIKINKELVILYFRASYSRRYVQLEELKSLFLRKFLIFGIIYHL